MKRLLFVILTLLICASPIEAQKSIIRSAGKNVAKKAFETGAKHQAEKAFIKGATQKAKKDAIMSGMKKTGNALVDQTGKKIMRHKFYDIAEAKGVKSLSTFGKQTVRGTLPLKDINRMRAASVKSKWKYMTNAQRNATRLQKKGIRSNVGAYGRYRYFRNGVNPSHQMVSFNKYSDCLKRSQDKFAKLTLNNTKDANVLRDNMLTLMGKRGKYIDLNKNAAHHLVGADPRMAKSANKLKKFNITVNDPRNGVFLPTDETSVLKGTIHRGKHSKEYCQLVNQKLANVKTEEECVKALDEIKMQLINGDIPLYDLDVNLVNL